MISDNHCSSRDSRQALLACRNGIRPDQRPYRQGADLDKGNQVIKEGAGSLYDRYVVESPLNLIKHSQLTFNKAPVLLA